MSYTTHDGNNNESFIVCTNTFFSPLSLVKKSATPRNQAWFCCVLSIMIHDSQTFGCFGYCSHSLLLWSDMSLRRLQIKRSSTGWLLFAFYLSFDACSHFEKHVSAYLQMSAIDIIVGAEPLSNWKLQFSHLMRLIWLKMLELELIYYG